MELIPESVEEAPTRIKIVAALVFLAGLFQVVLAIVSVVMHSAIAKVALLLLAGGLVDIILSFGLINGNKYAWMITVVLGIIWLARYIFIHNLLAAVIEALILVALITSANYYGINLFKKKSSTTSTTSTTTSTSTTPAPAPTASLLKKGGTYFQRIK